MKDEHLVTSDQTAFAIDFLVEMVLDIAVCNFEYLSKKYSLLHNRRLPSHVVDRRIESNRKRMADAYFLCPKVDLKVSGSKDAFTKVGHSLRNN